MTGVLVLGDLAAVAICLKLVDVLPWLTSTSFAKPFVALSIAIMLGFYLAEVYDAGVYRELTGLPTRLLIGLGFSGVVAGAVAFLIPAAELTRSSSAGFYLIALPVFGLWRLGFRRSLQEYLSPLRVAVIGSGPAANELIEALNDVSSHELVMTVTSGPSGDLVVSPEGFPTIGAKLDQLPDAVAANRVDLLAVAIPADDQKPMYSQLLACRYLGIEVQDMATCFEMLRERLPVRYLENSWVAFSSRFLGWNHGFDDKVKRLMDITLASGGLLLASPLILLIAFAVRTTSRGPALFRQERVGLRGGIYVILKFRSMRVDAENNGPEWAQEDDPRSTGLGHYLRKMHLDELPQLWNVLRGEMTLVGPRPERPEFVEHLRRQIPHYDLRHMVKPGLTGWAQVRYPYGASEKDAVAKLEYDLYYIRHKNFLWDLRILLTTVTVVLGLWGSR
jgi:exopolysaccharide biosynthesis polyprenyl glycosylphosphotransferase